MRVRVKVIVKLVLCAAFMVFTLSILTPLVNHADQSVVAAQHKRKVTAKQSTDPVLLQQMHDEDFAANLTSLRLYEQYKSQPFEDGLPKMVVVMTYQRSGSSFFGEIFDRNPDAFYVYEPLDALYTSMYGTAEGWNVPSDIKSFWNGSERVVPQHEVEAVAQYLEDLLACRTDQLPTEFFRHRYWRVMTRSFQSGQRSYNQCIKKLGLRAFKCTNILANVTCPMRIGADWQRLEYCRKSILSEDADNPRFLQYRKCNEEVRNYLDICIPILQRNCSSAAIHATKTVRATMASMDILLERNPNARVIHLVRDPRAVVLSRMKFYSTRGTHSHSDFVTEARLFCRAAVRDLHVLESLKTKYPGRIIQVIYDDFVRDPVGYSSAIYRFLDSAIPKETMDWLVTNTQVKKNSSLIALQWQYKIPYRKVLNINNHCTEYMKMIQFPWD